MKPWFNEMLIYPLLSRSDPMFMVRVEEDLPVCEFSKIKPGRSSRFSNDFPHNKACLPSIAPHIIVSRLKNANAVENKIHQINLQDWIITKSPVAKCMILTIYWIRIKLNNIDLYLRFLFKLSNVICQRLIMRQTKVLYNNRLTTIVAQYWNWFCFKMQFEIL